MANLRVLAAIGAMTTGTLGGMGCQKAPPAPKHAAPTEPVTTVAAPKSESWPPAEAQPAALVLPEPAVPMTVRWLDQGWSDEVRARAHHTSQGSATFPIPYEWFVALEQPSPTPEQESPLLVAPDYLSRFGFIEGQRSDQNPQALPIGFARTAGFPNEKLNPNPADQKPYTGIGFNCAACHTSALEFNSGKGQTRLLIDGGPANTDLGKFSEALAASLQALTVPARAARFMARVLSATPDSPQGKVLQAQIEGFGSKFKVEMAAEATLRARLGEGQVVALEGFGRLDALARIGNEVFWTYNRGSNGVTGNEFDANYVLPNAPVNFPPIWDAPWFDWVQYNGSIMQPMFRNFSEALGVGAVVNLGPKGPAQLASTVDVRALYQLERDIAGPSPFSTGKPAFAGLRSPRWPDDLLGKADPNGKLEKEGGKLYAAHCQRCHLPPTGSNEFWSKHWERDPGAAASAQRYLKLPLSPVEEIGTDPTHADKFLQRTVQLPTALGGDGSTVKFAKALGQLAPAITRAYDDANVPASERSSFDGDRPNLVQEVRGYRARPLNGVWATPPYLHNSSVRNLYELLSPVSKRATEFYLGCRTFDEELVGMNCHEAPGLFKLDTRLPGNHNTGHEFAEGKGEGIIGPYLTPSQRLALIAYLKTL